MRTDEFNNDYFDGLAEQFNQKRTPREIKNTLRAIVRDAIDAGRREQAMVDKQIINERLGAARPCGESAEFRNGLIAAHAILNLYTVAPKED